MRYAKIGGQAVIEGVMMRYGDRYAVAVRKPDHTVEVKTEAYEGLTAKWHMKNVPIIRGMLAFVDSLVLGMSTLTYSASFYEEEEEKPANDKTEKLMMMVTVAVSIILAIGLFMLTPFLISSLFERVIEQPMIIAVLEGIFRILIFLIYIVAISRMEDIQRVFMYHGAEHKTISCIEHGDELTPENAAKYSRLHKRCGTSFLLIVMILTIICFMFIRVDHMLLKIVLRVLLVPIIAGVSYEIIQWAGRSESGVVDWVSKPGLMLQKLTTREPDLEMLEVAIASIEAIYDWREFQRRLRENEEDEDA